MQEQGTTEQQKKPTEVIKERLQAHVDLIREYENQCERLERLTASMTAPKAQTYDGMPGGTPESDPMALQVARKIELEENIAHLLKEIRYDEGKIDAIIKQLDNAEERCILRLRYIDAEDWVDVAWIQYHKKKDYKRNTSGYLKRAYNKHGEALAHLVTKQFAQNDFVDAQTGAWTIMEYNASPVQPDSVQLQIYRDNALVTSVTPEIKGGMDDATGLYRYVYELDRNMFAQDGLYKVQVRSTDEAGNLSENIDEVDDNGNVTTPEKYQCTLSFVIDNVDPEFKQITGLEKRRYREDSHEINFAVADTYGLARVSVLSGETVVAEYLCAAEVDALGGETKLAANQKPMPNELTLESVSGDVMLQGGKSAQTITFVAVDKAGNTYTTGSADQKPLSFHQKVTISTNGFVLYIHNTWAVVLTVVALAAIAFGVWYGVSKKKKREGAAS